MVHPKDHFLFGLGLPGCFFVTLVRKHVSRRMLTSFPRAFLPTSDEFEVLVEDDEDPWKW